MLGAYATAVAAIIGLVLLLWRLLSRPVERVGDALAVGEIRDALVGVPPKGDEPGTRGLVDEVAHQGRQLVELKRLVTNGVAENARRAVEIGERAEATAREVKEDLGEHQEEITRKLDNLGEEVGRVSQRMREQTDLAAAVAFPSALIDTIAEHLRSQDDDGTGGET